MYIDKTRRGKRVDRLVKKLSTGTHPVLFEPKTTTLNEVKQRLNQGFVFVRFAETQGGTELGITVDNALTSLQDANFEMGSGTLHVAGTCTLNFQKVRCVADIDLATRHGIGYLELLDAQMDASISNILQ